MDESDGRLFGDEEQTTLAGEMLLDGHTYDQIAEALELPPSKVRAAFRMMLTEMLQRPGQSRSDEHARLVIQAAVLLNETFDALDQGATGEDRQELLKGATNLQRVARRLTPRKKRE